MNAAYILGAGGHGKVVLSTLRSAGIAVQGFFDEAPDLAGKIICGLPVFGNFDAFEDRHHSNAVIAVGNGAHRRMIASRFTFVTWIVAEHSRAWVDSTASVGDGSVVCAGAVIQPDTMIGVHCIINTGATVDHECRIGSFCHICPGVHLGGNVTVGEGSWIGIGSQVIQGVTIGQNVLIGAGSTVIRDIPDNAVAMGSPARVRRFSEC